MTTLIQKLLHLIFGSYELPYDSWKETGRRMMPK